MLSCSLKKLRVDGDDEEEEDGDEGGADDGEAAGT